MEDTRQNQTQQRASSRRAGIGRKLVLLMWKNLLLRKRHWVLTLFEVLLPTFLFTLIVSIRVLPDSAFEPTSINTNTTFKSINENKIREHFCEKYYGFWYGNATNISLPLPMERDNCYVIPNLSDIPMDVSELPNIPVFRSLLYGPEGNWTKNAVTYLAKKMGTQIPPNNLDMTSFMEAVSSNEELDEEIEQLYFKANSSAFTYFLGIYFNLPDNYDLASHEPPNHLDYDIRMQDNWHTQMVYPFLQIPGPRNFSFGGASYNLDGFTYVQTIIDRYYTSSLSENKKIDVLEQMELEAQMYPYPPYVQDNGMSQLYGLFLPTMVVLSYILLVPSLIKNIVYEKETGVRELVRLMGLDGWLVWLGWFLHSFMSIVVTATIITLFLKVSLVPLNEGDGFFPPILVHTDGFLLWFLLLLYGIASIAFCFAIATFFSKPTLATALGVVALLVSFFIPRGLMDYQYDTLSLSAKLLSCLLPNMCITWAFKVISMFEGRSVGVNMSNLWDTGNPKDQLTPGMILIMLAVDSVLYLFITWYVDQVNPGKYGVPQPYYFPLQKSYWCGGKVVETDSTNSQNLQNFELEPAGLTPGIVIKNLRKEFKSMCNSAKVAVEDVTLTCYEGQCTVLLGHNGAGKTTTMSVLTGVYAPTSGSAQVAGWDIATNLKEARAETGLCPQHNMLFTDLTVNEHLLFFAKLKGLSNKEAEEEAVTLMKRLELIEKNNMFGKQLSGGMKRKLCLAISLIGGSKVIILDEPSSGLDPESRRWVWEVIQRERSKRTVLVTTHHMEEADVLGDRVAIMAEGKIICSGSTLFLKKKFGDGYSLTVTINENSNVETISNAVIENLPDSRMTSSMGGEIIFKLPSETSCFGTLLDSLTNQKDALGIKHVGLSLTSMEQVFLKVGGILDNRKEANNKNEDFVTKNGLMNNKEKVKNNWTNNSNGSISTSKSSQKLCSNQMDMEQEKNYGWELLLQRFKALFVKRFIYSKRKWVLLITQAIIPVIVTIMCLLVDALFDESTGQQDVRNLTLSMYESSKSYVYATNDTLDFGNGYESYIQDLGAPFTVDHTENLTRSLLDDAIEDEFDYRENSICSAEFLELTDNTKTISRYLYQSVPYHCAGVSVNIMNNAILRTVVGNEAFSIQTNNRPLPNDPRYRLDNSGSSGSSIIYSMMMPMALAFLSASFIVFPLEERESKAKQVQIMTGTPAWALWFTSLVWDLVSYIISSLIVFMFFMVLDSKGYWTDGNAPGVLFLLLLLYGWGGLTMAYLFSFPFSTAASGYAILTLVNIVAGQIVSTATWALEVADQPNLNILRDVLEYLVSFIPAYPASKAFMYMVDISNYNSQCDIFNTTQKEELCKDLVSINPSAPFLSCCENVDMNNPYEYCQPSWNITELNLTNTVACFEKYSYFRWESPGLSQHLLYLLADGFLYLLLLTLIELGTWKFIIRKFQQCMSRSNVSAAADDNRIEDDDVITEADLVKDMMQSGSREAAMVVSGLTKQFPGATTPAVNQVSFHVKRGECFGLLGVNGAGKTTTFRMLTADEDPSSGDAMIDGVALRQNGGKKFLECIGYCPQFDATLGELTGFEMLILVGRLRGIPENQLVNTTTTLIGDVDIVECANRPSSTYSGGNRRKLSTAMALIGSPSLVFLDEPTSGVDPASRRRVWAAVTQAISNGQSVVLTSHSMEECEALCSRIVIMSRGKLRCIGSTAHLKAKFGKGYSLQVKLKMTDAIDYDAEVKKLKSDIQTQLPNSIITDEHKGMLAYKVPTSISWGKLFDVMEGLKTGTESETSIVEDYAASDTSLEQVFLSFARESYGAPKDESLP